MTKQSQKKKFICELSQKFAKENPSMKFIFDKIRTFL